MRVVRTVFPRLNDWLNRLPDPRLQELCLYAAAHLWWQIIATFLSRQGSRNAFDEQRQSGQAAWNMGALCGQTPEDPRFAGQPAVTCSDNAAHHAHRVDPELVAQIPVLMFQSKGDKVIDTDSVQQIYDHLGTSDKQMNWVEDSGHVIVREPERERVFKAADEFVHRVSGI